MLPDVDVGKTENGGGAASRDPIEGRSIDHATLASLIGFLPLLLQRLELRSARRLRLDTHTKD